MLVEGSRGLEGMGLNELLNDLPRRWLINFGSILWRSKLWRKERR
jgi:hypothetical protein